MRAGARQPRASLPLALACLVGSGLLFFGTGGASAAGSAASGAGKLKAFGCVACHGRDGLAKAPGAPNLAGQVEEYLAAALTAYRSGVRSNEVMNTAAARLGDTDIEDLAAYYAAIVISVTPPPKP